MDVQSNNVENKLPGLSSMHGSALSHVILVSKFHFCNLNCALEGRAKYNLLNKNPFPQIFQRFKWLLASQKIIYII